MPTHKRGGAYSLEIMTDVTNWIGCVLNREILNHLKVSDIVRVIFLPWGTPRYIEITHIFSNGYFKGVVNNPYRYHYCNICNKTQEKNRPLYQCKNYSRCDYDCHLDCYNKHSEMRCDCNVKLEKKDCHLMNDSVIVFKKNNISEIPNWSKNTERLIEIYKTDKNYCFTGVR